MCVWEEYFGRYWEDIDGKTYKKGGNDEASLVMIMAHHEQIPCTHIYSTASSCQHINRSSQWKISRWKDNHLQPISGDFCLRDSWIVGGLNFIASRLPWIWISPLPSLGWSHASPALLAQPFLERFESVTREIRDYIYHISSAFLSSKQ